MKKLLTFTGALVFVVSSSFASTPSNSINISVHNETSQTVTVGNLNTYLIFSDPSGTYTLVKETPVNDGVVISGQLPPNFSGLPKSGSVETFIYVNGEQACGITFFALVGYSSFVTKSPFLQLENNPVTVTPSHNYTCGVQANLSSQEILVTAVQYSATKTNN